MVKLFDPLFGIEREATAKMAPEQSEHVVEAHVSPVNKQPMQMVMIGPAKGPKFPALADLTNRIVLPDVIR